MLFASRTTAAITGRSVCGSGIGPGVHGDGRGAAGCIHPASNTPARRAHARGQSDGRRFVSGGMVSGFQKWVVSESEREPGGIAEPVMVVDVAMGESVDGPDRERVGVVTSEHPIDRGAPHPE